ncbi:MAG TPA: nucleoside hydrolase [Bryobacteraceae bacterium]|nr:nucleoside hydrolase [Bryobacteraceae bacterium]
MNRLCLLLIVVIVSRIALGAPVRLVFDTDMGNDIDDGIALAMLHAFESRGEVKLLAITVTKDNPEAASFIDLVDTFYGHGSIPVGVVKGGKTPNASKILSAAVEKKTAAGRFVYPRHIQDGREAPDATVLLRRILSSEPDDSVVFVQVGFSTNLARLLDSEPDGISPLSGKELVARKARLLSIMAGHYPTGDPEYNVKTDLPASRKVFGEWPTPIIASGWEVGATILYPATSIERDFSYVENHPIVDGYRAYKKMPYDRPCWDPTAVLYAVRPDGGYFSLSQAGRITLDSEGRTRFTLDSTGKHRYLIVNDIQRARVREVVVDLASQPPSQRIVEHHEKVDQ